MASAYLIGSGGLAVAGISGVGSRTAHPGAAVGKLRLPTDPAGSTSVTFDGIVPGTEIHVYLPDESEVAGTESCVAGQVLSWPVYAPGSPNNTVTITLIKRGLRWQKFTYTSRLGDQSLPIFQVPDLGYSNPA